MAKQQFDIALNDALEIQFSGGDVQLAESTGRHQQLLLMSRPSQVPFFPLRGVGLGDQHQNDAGEREVARLIQREFKLDGLTIDILKVRNLSDMDIKLNAHYP